MKDNGYNTLLKGFSGTFGRVFVIRRYRKKSVIAALPRRSRKAPTEARKRQMSMFGRAVLFARQIKANPSLLNEYNIKVKKHQSVYHAAIAAFMERKGEL